MAKDCGVNLAVLKVDGGMTLNNLFLQMQSDLLTTKICKFYQQWITYFCMFYYLCNKNILYNRAYDNGHSSDNFHPTSAFDRPNQI